MATMGTIFYSDAHMKHLLCEHSPRYTNVFENSWGDYYYGVSHSNKDACDYTMRAYARKRHKPMYRIVVRRKNA